MTLCEYGCGNPATYFKFPSAKTPHGRYMCSLSPNSCPTKRNKLIGDKNPAKRLDVRQSISKINSILFASGSENRLRCQATLIQNYGVSNPMHDLTIAKKVVDQRKEKQNYTGWPKSVWNDDVKQKRKQTRVKKGYDIDPLLKDPFDLYESEVDRLTEKTYKTFQYFINPKNHKRGRTKGSWQLDHIMSKVSGFESGIPAELLAHPANLQMLPIKENISKSSTSHFNKDELLEAIERFNSLTNV